jgi:hypothetical protein
VATLVLKNIRRETAIVHLLLSERLSF